MQQKILITRKNLKKKNHITYCYHTYCINIYVYKYLLAYVYRIDVIIIAVDVCKVVNNARFRIVIVNY